MLLYAFLQRVLLSAVFVGSHVCVSLPALLRGHFAWRSGIRDDVLASGLGFVHVRLEDIFDKHVRVKIVSHCLLLLKLH